MQNIPHSIIRKVKVYSFLLHLCFTKLLMIFFGVCLFPLIASPSDVKYESIPKEYTSYIYAEPDSLQWFEEARYGVFVHWGPYSLAQVPASWGRHGPRPGAGKQAKSGVPEAVYDDLYKQFNPVHFNADEWIRMVKQSGAKYFIFTAKHHDGFCMFDAKNTDYKITNTPFGRDVAKELANACHKHGIKLFWYYSQPDWFHEDCLTVNNDRYRKYMFEHLEQLLTNYGPIAGLFFDGLGTKYYHWDTPRMLKMCRTLQDGIIINRRWGGGMPGYSVNGDYDNPEQEIGRFQIDRPWESNMTMSEAWSWTGGKRVKTFQTCLRMLIQCIGSGGNLALNTGPKPNGTINPPERENYLRIGEWLSKYGDSIYGTKGGPYKPAPWGVSCRKGKKVYLHILSKFMGATKIEIPDLPLQIKRCEMLTGGLIDFVQKDGLLTLKLDPRRLDSIDNIVVLTLEKNVEKIHPIDSPKHIQTAYAHASSAQSGRNSIETFLERSHGNFVEGKKHKGWWAAKGNDKAPWLSIHFNEKTELNYISISEQIRNCSTRKFVIEYDINGLWKTLYEGEQIGMDFSLKTPVIETSALRIRFLKNAFGQKPNLLKFEAYSMPSSEKRKQPNVLFILADDLGIEGLHCYGNDWLETPNIDRLCKTGIKCTGGLAPFPICKPSRAATLTGQYSPRTGVYRVTDRHKGLENKIRHLVPQNRFVLPRTPLINRAFKDAGYATAMYGKWHISNEKKQGNHPTNYAFDEAIVSAGGHFQATSTPEVNIPQGSTMEEVLTDRAIAFMKKAVSTNQPFFLYMPYFWIHKPLEADPKLIEYFEKKLNALELVGKHPNDVPTLAAMTKMLDEQIGRLLQALENLNVEENTIVVFSSDNGAFNENFVGKYRGLKGDTYEGGMRVPYIFKWPGHIQASTTTDERIIGIDLYPTLLSLAGLSKPKGHFLDGIDLSPLLLGKRKTLPQREIYCFYPKYSQYNKKTKRWKNSWKNVIYDAKYKLIESPEYNEYELFDLNIDPFEKNELSTRLQTIKQKETKKLHRWLKKINAPKIIHNPGFINEK